MPRSTIAFQSLRRVAVGFALTLAALMGWQHLSAQAIAAHNSNAPVDFSADRIELQDRQNRVVLSGDVRIEQAGLTLNAGRTTVSYSDSGELEIERIDATGGVIVTRGNESARGSVAVYDFGRRMIIMSGNVSLRRGGDTLNGGRLVIDLRTGLSSVDGSSGGSGRGGRVSGTFQVPD